MFLHGTLVCLIWVIGCHSVTGISCEAAISKMARHCPPPWLAYEGNCYLYVPQAKTYNDSEAYCANFSNSGRSVHLASVANQEENDFMDAYARAANSEGVFWIGYNDQKHEGNFTWTDGTPADFELWHTKEPNNLNNQDCVRFLVIRSGHWDDEICNTTANFMCEMQKIE